MIKIVIPNCWLEDRYSRGLPTGILVRKIGGFASEVSLTLEDAEEMLSDAKYYSYMQGDDFDCPINITKAATKIIPRLKDGIKGFQG